MRRDSKGRFLPGADPRKCECGKDVTLTEPEWVAMTKEERAALREAGLDYHAGRGKCTRCRRRDVRRQMSAGTGRNNGWRVTYEESEFFYGLGMTEVEVARKLGIQVESLRRSRKRYVERQESAA